MLLALLACACPTFDALPVENPDGLGTAEEVGIVAAAIAEFAGWTGREGVCVDRVEIIEAIDWRPEAATGLYRSDDPEGRIWIETGGTVMRRRGQALAKPLEALYRSLAPAEAARRAA